MSVLPKNENDNVFELDELPPVPVGEFDRYGNWVDLSKDYIRFHDPSTWDMVMRIKYPAHVMETN